MSEKRDLSNRQYKWIIVLLSVIFTAKYELAFVLTIENAFSRVFILRRTERA